jgi:hypothetical protein
LNRQRAWFRWSDLKKTKENQMVEGIPEGWELVRIGIMTKGDWAIGGDGKPFEYIREKPGNEYWPIIRKVEPSPAESIARRVLEEIAVSVGVDPLGVDSPDLAEMIVQANKKREQHDCRQRKPDFTGREMDLVEAIANLRDNMDRLNKRVGRLETKNDVSGHLERCE